MSDAAKPSIDEDQILRAKLVAFRARIAKLEAALQRFADDDLWGHSGYWHEWHGSDDPKTFARNALSN